MDDYGSIMQSGYNLVPDFQQQLLRQAQIGEFDAAAQERRAHAAEIAQQQARAQQFQQSFAASDGSPQAVSRLITQFPEFADHIKQGWDVVDKANHEQDLTQLGEIYSAANAGRWDIAAKLAHSRIDAERAANRNDPGYDAVIDTLDKAVGGDAQAQATAKTMLGSVIAAKTGPEHFGTVYGALNGSPHVLTPGSVLVDNESHVVAHSPLVQGADGTLYDYNSVMGGGGQASPGAAATAAPGSGGDGNPPPAGPDQAITHVLKHEGGYLAKDGNGYPTNFGINAKANSAELNKRNIADIATMTKPQAVEIYKDKYWPASGAANLPANLQAPYFDVYIRSPAMAKQLLAKSGGDPVTFATTAKETFQNLAKNNPDKYGRFAKAWANRDDDNIAVAKAGTAAPGAAPAGGPRVLLPGKNSPDQYHTLTPDEVKSRGLDPGQQYQLNTQTGQVAGLGKRDAADDDVLGQYHIGQSETGATVLNKLPANMASQVKALAEGRLPMPSSFALAKPYWQKMLQLTAQYDPSFDAANAPARKAAITAFTGNGKAAQVVGSVNRVANHLALLWNTSNGLAGPDTGFGPLNKALATAGQSMQPDLAKQYDTEVGFVAGELEKIARNSPGTEAGVDRVIQNLGRHNSLKTRQSALRAAVGIISGAVDPLKDQYNSAFTNDSTRPNIPWVSPKAQKIYSQIGGVDMSLTGAGADSNAPASGAAPHQPGAVQIHTAEQWHALKPGTRYIDPTGVQRIKK